MRRITGRESLRNLTGVTLLAAHDALDADPTSTQTDPLGRVTSFTYYTGECNGGECNGEMKRGRS